MYRREREVKGYAALVCVGKDKFPLTKSMGAHGFLHQKVMTNNLGILSWFLFD